MPALGKVILVLKRYLSSCLKEGRRPVAICAPWTGGKLKWSINQIWSNQIEILSAYCKRYLFHASAMLSLLTNFVLHSGPVISNLNPFPFNLPLFFQPFAISYFVFGFLELSLLRAVARKKIWCQCFEVIPVDLCCPWPKINPVSVFQTPVHGRVER